MSEQIQKSHQETIPFYPDHVISEAKVVAGITAIVVIIGLLGLLFPLGLGDPADPLNTPQHVKPEWYFLGLYQLLKYIPKTTGAVLPVIMLIVLMFWPFIDRKPDRSVKPQRIRLAVVTVGMLALIALTIWGEVS